MVLIVFQVLSHQRSFMLLSLVDNLSDIWGPLIEFHGPVSYSGERYYHKERTLITLGLNKITEQTDCLNSLTESHFISKNSI